MNNVRKCPPYTDDAVHRYAMNQMDLCERNAFEAHLFNCEDCTREVFVTWKFTDNLRAVWDGTYSTE
jgi:anti-sigma factor RsiW